MNNSKLVYGIGLIALSLAVFFLATKTKNKLKIHFGETHWGKPHSKALDSFSIAGITKLSANGACEVELIAADSERVVFYYDKDEVENESGVKDGTLEVDFKNYGSNIFSRKSRGVKVKIYTHSISRIAQDGVGSIMSNDTLVHGDITLSNNGVGSMNFKLRAKIIDIANGGVGSIEVAGIADDAEIKNEGTGSIEAEKLVLKRAKVSNQGIGSVAVYASETLDMTNQGVGSIDYSGEAKVLHSKSEGVGSINKK